MEFFKNSEDKSVRLRSHHNKFLIADTDENTLTQHGNGASTASRWLVEFVDEDGESNATTIRLKSLKTNMYLSASEEPFKQAISAKRATQALPSAMSIEWVPLLDGHGRVMLRARSTGTFLCANGSLLPWRNSVTHDMLSAVNVDWATWAVDIVAKDPNVATPKTKAYNSFNNQEPAMKDVDKPPPLEVRKAKQTLMEVHYMDFKSVYFSKKLRCLESSISVVLGHPTNDKGSTSKLLSLQEQLQALKLDQRRSTDELTEYQDFIDKKVYMKGELRKGVTKARELLGREEKVEAMLRNARSKRAGLMRELEKVEWEIEMAEKDQVKNKAELDEVCKVIGKRNEVVKQMGREESVWSERRDMAERRIEEVENRWNMIKASLYVC